MKRREMGMKLIINCTGPSRADQTLLKTIARAHNWFNELAAKKVKNMAEIVSRENVDKSYVSRVVNLSFLLILTSMFCQYIFIYDRIFFCYIVPSILIGCFISSFS